MSIPGLAQGAACGGASTTRISRTRSARTWRSPPTSGWPTAPIDRARSSPSLKDFGNVTLTTEAARRVWTPWWLDALHDQVSDVRYAIRALREEPGVLAHRRRRAHARHRPERRRLHDAQGHRAQPDRRRRPGRPGSPSIFGETSAGPRSRRVVSRLPVPSRSRSRVLGALRHRARSTVNLGRGRRRPPGLGRARHRQLLSDPRRSCRTRPHAPAVGRDRARPPSGRRASATVCGGAISAPIRTSSARRSRSTTTR